MLCRAEELRSLFLWPSGGTQVFPSQDEDEVYPGIYVGNAILASDIRRLKDKGIGYVLNAAYGQDTSLNLMEVFPEEMYEACGIKFIGIAAIDMMSFQLCQHFDVSTAFISEALRTGSKVLVHCKQGISRSASLVLAYLVQKEQLTVQEAARIVREQREVLPNDGFIQQLCELNESVHGAKKREIISV